MGGVTCAVACDRLFTCAIASDMGSKLCVGLDAADQSIFINGAVEPGCLAGCATTPSIIGLIDPNDCPATVKAVAAANTEFADACACGVGLGGCGAGGSGGN
jgi:hypothetical protein